MGYVALHCHSTFSFHAGVCTPAELVQWAKATGTHTIALTDTDRVSGLILFYLECCKSGIKPILGAELTEPGHPNENIVILAKNAQGYGDLCEIITKRHLNPRFSYRDVFQQPWPNLILFTNFPDLLVLLAATPNKNNLYGELVNHSKLTRSRSKALEKKAPELSVPLFVSNNSFFLHKQDWKIHQVLSAIGLNSTLSRLKADEYASSQAFTKTADEMRSAFPRHQNAIDHSEQIARQCHTHLELNKWILPEISVPDGSAPKAYLAKIAKEGLDQNFLGKETYQRARQIQEMELEVISKLGYDSYFLFVKEIRDWANNRLQTDYRRPKDCTILRGSAANSITFYNIGVSDLDPIEFDLYFQRFLNEDRASPPDADLDFGWDERDDVLDHIINKWGTDRVAITCTINHFRNRAAFRETAKVFGYSEEQVTRIIDSRKTSTKRIDDSEIRFLMHLAKKIQGKPRFLGQHPGGVLITNDPIWRHVALERSGGEKDRTITQIDMHNGIDELGLLKFDILGNGSLSVLRDSLQQLEDQGLPDPDVNDLEKCYHDPAVQDIIKKGRTKGIFYIESPAQTRLNKKANVESFEELAITSSLIRPAGAAYTQLFVERHRKMKMGIKDWDFLHPSLEPILQETHDVCAFQEDVTKICHHVAGLSYKKSDRIRKMMNSLHEGAVPEKEWLDTSHEFIKGCMKTNGLTFEQAKELWKRVSSFTGFSFCKSHSASYAQLSFQCTYMKAYYPAQFLSSVISNNHGFYSRDAYLNEARRWGIHILPIDINDSHIKYFGKHTWIRPGLMHIRSLSQKSQEKIVLERQANGMYRDIEDFIHRVDSLRRNELENLVLAGALDSFGLTQPELLYLVDGAYGKKQTAPRLFGSLRLRELHPGLHDYSLTEKCLNELHMLGYMLSGNIIDILDLHPASKNAVSMNRISDHVGKGMKLFGWPVTERVHMVEGTRKPMMFLTLEDKTACVDVIFWPRTYQRFADLLSEPGPYEVWGKVTEDWDTFSVEAELIKAVEWSPGQVDFEMASKRLKESYTTKFTYEDVSPISAA